MSQNVRQRNWDLMQRAVIVCAIDENSSRSYAGNQTSRLLYRDVKHQPAGINRIRAGLTDAALYGDCVCLADCADRNEYACQSQ